MDNLVEIFKGKRIFITGHTGFKGGWLTYWLWKLGALVKGYSLKPDHENSLYKILDISSKCKSVYGNILEHAKLKKEIIDFNPDYIFHLAAQPLVIESYRQPMETYQTNVIGTGNLLDVLRYYPNQCTTIIITTDKVYENKEWIYPYRETDRLGGHDPYSTSKACAELVVQSFVSSYFPLAELDKHRQRVATARAGNVIGGGDWSSNRIIPDIIRSLNQEQPISIRNPSAIRPWQHVLEPLYGYLLLAIRLQEDPTKYSGAWNFGPHPGLGVNVKNLTELAIKNWGCGEMVIEDKKSSLLHESKTLKLDISKSRSTLNWNPIFTEEESIEMTISWYKKFINGEKANHLVDRDIDHFTKRLNS